MRWLAIALMMLTACDDTKPQADAGSAPSDASIVDGAEPDGCRVGCGPITPAPTIWIKDIQPGIVEPVASRVIVLQDGAVVIGDGDLVRFNDAGDVLARVDLADRTEVTVATDTVGKNDFAKVYSEGATGHAVTWYDGESLEPRWKWPVTFSSQPDILVIGTESVFFMIERSPRAAFLHRFDHGGEYSRIALPGLEVGAAAGIGALAGDGDLLFMHGANFECSLVKLDPAAGAYTVHPIGVAGQRKTGCFSERVADTLFGFYYADGAPHRVEIGDDGATVSVTRTEGAILDFGWTFTRLGTHFVSIADSRKVAYSRVSGEPGVDSYDIPVRPGGHVPFYWAMGGDGDRAFLAWVEQTGLSLYMRIARLDVPAP
jgi:hypothetical protein